MDDMEVSRALKQFGEKTRSTNLAFKKTKLVKILRSQTSQTRVRGKPKKSRQNPFEFLIFEQKDDEFENIDENEFFALMNDIKFNNYPNSKKFANALIYFPEKTKQFLPKIYENIQNNREPFQGLFLFDNEEDLVSYLTRTSLFCGDKWQEHMDRYFSFYFNQEDKEKIELAKKETIRWTLKDFYNYINDNKNEISLHIYQYAYLLTHNDVDKSIKHCFIEEIMASLLQSVYKKVDALNKSQEDIEEYQKNIKELNEIKQQVDLLKNENTLLIKELKQKDKQINHIKLESEKKLNEKLAEYNKLKENMECNFTKKIEHFAEQIKNNERIYNKKLADIQNENEKLKKELNEIQLYIEYAFPANEDRSYEFAVVHCIETKLVSIIYPEVLFINVNEWSERFRTLPKDIHTIYIVREGLSNRQVGCIQKDAKAQSIETKMIFAGNEKALIENIAILKNDKGEM